MLEELHRHGYRLSPGTLYPLLARMARRGWLRSAEPKKSRDARVYRITPEGAEVLKRLRASLGELQHEVTPASRSQRRAAAAPRRARGSIRR
jgi:DNA-binding PadR family transcriptional regulator